MSRSVYGQDKMATLPIQGSHSRRPTTTNNNNFIYTLESVVKLHSVVFTITYSKTSWDKDVNTLINYLHYTKTDQFYH